MLGWHASGGAARGQAENPGPLKVTARVIDTGPFFVGQAIGIEVVTSAGRERPLILPPRLIHAELVPESTGVGQSAVSQTDHPNLNKTNDHINLYNLVPERSGLLQVPPFTARVEAEGRSGRSPPLSLTIRDLPAAGRARAFLGGVGTLERVEAEAVPTTVRQGQTFEFRLRLLGTAARGSTAQPDLAALNRVPLGLRVEPLPAEVADTPPSRTLRFRIRATVAGEADLPSIPIAAFDPRLQTYLTWRSPRVPLRVVAVPRFDPTEVAYEPAPPTMDPFWPIAATAMVAAGTILALSLLARRLACRRGQDPARFARRVARGLDKTTDPVALANQIEAGLAGYLQRAQGRPAGALTPDEAGEGLAALGHDTERSRHARLVIEKCDRVRYSGQEVPVQALRDDARPLFQWLGRRPPT